MNIRRLRERIEDLSSQIRMKIFVFLWLLTLQFFQIKGIEDIYYRHNNVRCEKCDKGQKVKVHCSEDLQKSECVACEEGTFADRYSSSTLCETCSECSDTGRIIKKNCTPEKNTECECPDKKYYNLGFCMTCIPPKIKRVRDKKEYCEDCEYGSYYNIAVENCVKCDICTQNQYTLHVCNVTHNTQCEQKPTSSPITTQVFLTGKREEGLRDDEIAGVVIAAVIIILVFIAVGVFFLKRKKKCCFEKKYNREKDKEAGVPLKSGNGCETQPSQSSRESSNVIKNVTSCTFSEIQQSPSQPENHNILSSKPEWLNQICTILINNLGQLHQLVTHLGSQEFNATAKWDQLDGTQIEERFLKVMNIWFEQSNHPTTNHIISALKDMNRNDIVKFIDNDVLLKEHLIKENTSARIKNKDHDVPSDNKRNGIDELKLPIQATDDGQSDKLISTEQIDSVDNKLASLFNINVTNHDLPDPHQTQPKAVSGSVWDEEQTHLKQPSSG